MDHNTRVNELQANSFSTYTHHQSPNTNQTTAISQYPISQLPINNLYFPSRSDLGYFGLSINSNSSQSSIPGQNEIGTSDRDRNYNPQDLQPINQTQTAFQQHILNLIPNLQNSSNDLTNQRLSMYNPVEHCIHTNISMNVPEQLLSLFYSFFQSQQTNSVFVFNNHLLTKLDQFFNQSDDLEHQNVAQESQSQNQQNQQNPKRQKQSTDQHDSSQQHHHVHFQQQIIALKQEQQNLYEILKPHLDSPLEIFQQSPQSRLPPLMSACRIGNLLLIKHLIEHENNGFGNQLKSDQFNILHCVVDGDNVEMIDYVMKLDGVEALLEDVDIDGYTPLLHAFKTNKLNSLKHLINKYNPNLISTNKQQQHILHLISRTNDPSLIDFVMPLNGVEELLEVVDKDGNTPIFYATLNRKFDFYHQFIESYQASYLHVNNNARNILHCAVEAGDVDGIDFFLSLPGTDALLEGIDRDGNTPLLLACKLNQLPAVKSLIECYKVNGQRVIQKFQIDL
jgi:ankyrin repeat protein